MSRTSDDGPLSTLPTPSYLIVPHAPSPIAFLEHGDDRSGVRAREDSRGGYSGGAGADDGYSHH